MRLCGGDIDLQRHHDVLYPSREGNEAQTEAGAQVAQTAPDTTSPVPDRLTDFVQYLQRANLDANSLYQDISQPPLTSTTNTTQYYRPEEFNQHGLPSSPLVPRNLNSTFNLQNTTSTQPACGTPSTDLQSPSSTILGVPKMCTPPLYGGVPSSHSANQIPHDSTHQHGPSAQPAAAPNAGVYTLLTSLHRHY